MNESMEPPPPPSQPTAADTPATAPATAPASIATVTPPTNLGSKVGPSAGAEAGAEDDAKVNTPASQSSTDSDDSKTLVEFHSKQKDGIVVGEWKVTTKANEEANEADADEAKEVSEDKTTWENINANQQILAGPTPKPDIYKRYMTQSKAIDELAARGMTLEDISRLGAEANKLLGAETDHEESPQSAEQPHGHEQQEQKQMCSRRTAKTTETIVLVDSSSSSGDSGDSGDSEELPDPTDDAQIPVEGEGYQIIKTDPDEWLQKDTLFHFLHKSRIAELGNKTHKASMLMPFFSDNKTEKLYSGSVKRVFPYQFLRSHPDLAIEMDTMEKMLRPGYMSKGQYKWSVPLIANGLRKCWKWIQALDQSPYSTKGKLRENKTIKATRKYMESALKRIEVDVQEKHCAQYKGAAAGRSVRATIESLGRQPAFYIRNGTTVQDEIYEKLGKEWIKNWQPKVECPFCEHKYLVFANDPNLINAENARLKNEFSLALAKYNSLTKAQREKQGVTKPKVPDYPEVYYACMCCVNNCSNFVTGDGCRNCEHMAEAKMPIPYDHQQAKCTCPICQCPCNKYFARSKLVLLTNKMRQLRLEEGVEKKATARTQSK